MRPRKFCGLVSGGISGDTVSVVANPKVVLKKGYDWIRFLCLRGIRRCLSACYAQIGKCAPDNELLVGGQTLISGGGSVDSDKIVLASEPSTKRGLDSSAACAARFFLGT